MITRKEFRKYATDRPGITGSVVDDVISHVYGPEMMTRTVIEERNMPFREVDVFSRLMADRIIFLGMEIDDYIANIIQAQLLFLESADSQKDIQIYLNSPGGSVYAGLGIYDTMQYINPHVATICTGMAASMAAVLLCAGEKGKRTGLKHARVMIHQPLGGARGQASDIEITAREIQKLKKELYEIIALHSNQTYDKVWGDSDRDYWMIAQEARDYGMIDEVLEKKK
ncbi:MAG: ATP-dependent Clp endopeptidase proteolytic subunit ClpP [Flavobacteriales bacterium]|nr:ATP-dependent Clp endopeptidase proteolytic subunit ClpP [Flavobacteriales bacterium]